MGEKTNRITEESVKSYIKKHPSITILSKEYVEGGGYYHISDSERGITHGLMLFLSPIEETPRGIEGR